MNSAIQNRVLAATVTCLRPLARILLSAGINFRQFSEAAKHAFLEEAASERDARGRSANVSRVAVRTGLSRKEVARIRDNRPQQLEAASDLVGEVRNASHAARALQLWYSDARFVDPSGAPKELPFSGDDASFTAVIRAVGGDVPAGAVRAELLAAGAVVESAAGSLKLAKRHFVPGNVDEDLVIGLTQIVHPVLEGLARNTGREKLEPFIQRLAYSDRLVPSAVPLFREIARDRITDFVDSVDDWLISNEVKPGALEGQPLRVGVGVFYYEGKPDCGAESPPPISP